MTQPTTKRYQLRSEAFGAQSGLRRPLNDTLLDISKRLVALESVAGVWVMPPLELLTGASVAPRTSPFPLQLQSPPNFTPKGLVLLAIENSTDGSGISTSGVSVWWHAASEGLVLDMVTGLDVVTKYRLTLGAIRG